MFCLHAREKEGIPWYLSGKESAFQCRRCWLDTWVGKILWRRKWQLTPVFLPENSHGEWSLVGYSLQGHKRVGQDLETEQKQGKKSWRFGKRKVYVSFI